MLQGLAGEDYQNFVVCSYTGKRNADREMLWPCDCKCCGQKFYETDNKIRTYKADCSHCHFRYHVSANNPSYVPKQAVPNNERKNRIDDFIDRHTQAGHKLVLVKLYAPGNSQSKLEVQQLKSNINICHRAFARLIQTKPLKLIKGFVRVTKIAWDYSLQKPLPYLYILFSFGSEEDYKYIDWNKVWQKSYGQKDTQAKSVAYIPVLFDEFLFSYNVDEIPSKKLDVVFVAVKGLKLVSVSRGDKKPDEESPEDAAA